MKKSRKLGKIIGMVLGTVFCLSLVSYAAGGPDGPGPDGKKGFNEGDRIIRMKDKLALTDDQVSKIKALFENSKKNIEPLMKQQDADIKSIETKLKANASDKELNTLLDTLDADHQKILDARKETTGQLRTILTPTQQAKSIIALSERMEKWKKAGPGPGKKRNNNDDDDK